jgi:predicted exporter
MNTVLATRHRVAVLGAWLLALALLLVVVARAHYTADLTAFLPTSPEPRQQMLITQLQSGLPSRTLLIGIEGGDAPARAAASRELAATLRTSGLFEQVQNGERTAFAAIGRWLFEQRYALSPAVTAERFGDEGLRNAIGETLSLLGTPAGAGAREWLPRDPTGEMQRIAESLIPAEAPRMEDGVWVSRESPRAVLLATTRADGADIDAQQAAIERVQAAFAAAAARGLVLQVSGAPALAVQSRALIEREVHWLAIVAAVLVLLVLLAAFASPRALVVALLPVATGVLAGIAGVALVFGHVHGMTLGFGATLIGEAVDYAIYYLVQARRAGAAPGSGWRHWVASGWPTLRLGLWTSICGFAALLFSGFPGLAQLGVFSIAGLVAAALTTRWVLPVCLPDGAPGAGLRRYLGAATAWALARLPRLRWPVLVLAASSIVLLVQRADLWRADLAAMSPLPRAALAVDAELRRDLGASDARTLVLVQGADAETTLQRAEAAALRLDGLVERGELAGYDSVTRFLPSRAAQEARRASLPDPAGLPERLARATRGTPLEKNASTMFLPFVAEVGHARAAAPLTPEMVDSSPVKPLVEALLLRPRPQPQARAQQQPSSGPGASHGSYTALLPLQAAPAAAGRPQGGIDATALAQALQGLPGTTVLDVKAELDGLYGRYLREALWQSILGAGAVILLVAATLRSARRTLAVCQPLAFAVLLTLAGLALAGVQLGILHLVGLLLVVAVGSNYALFFDQVQQGGAPDADTLASLLLANVTLVASFAVLAFSQIPALTAIGRVVAPGALLGLVLAAVFARRPSPASFPGSAVRSM